jgi:formylglycine-generating enzyme required for sulfatase activity
MLSSRIYLQCMALLISTIIASPALGESPFYDSECDLNASSEMAQPLEVATRALPRSPLQPIAGTFPPMRIPKSLSAAEQRALRPQDLFKECEVCPEMVVVPAGEFTMGAPETEKGSDADERPRRRVAFANRLTVGRFAVTFAEWDACVAEGGCKRYRPSDRGWGREHQPASIFGGRMLGPT